MRQPTPVNFGECFEALKLHNKLSAIDRTSFIGLSIQVAIENKRPIKEIAMTVLEHYQDAPRSILRVIPQDTIDLIKRIYPQ